MSMILALALTMSQPAPAGGDVTRELTQFEQRLAATWKKGDCAAWGEMIAAEWSVTHLTGEVIPKARALEMCRTPDAPIETLEIDDLLVRLFGDAAVVTGRTRFATGGATPIRIALRFTDVFVRRGGRWQVVASQSTGLGSPQAPPSDVPLGTWSGNWDGAGSGGGFELTLARDKDGAIGGSVSVTGEPTYQATLRSVAFEGRKMTAKYDFPPDDAAEVVISASFDGDNVTGTWSLREKASGSEVATGGWKAAKKGR